MNLSTLALMNPRFRVIAPELDRLPVAERKPRFFAWLKAQPDGRGIWVAMTAARHEDVPPWQRNPEVN
jgi:hypothetical protein